jgi:hypothetical protein
MWDELKVRVLPRKLINIIKEVCEDFCCRVLHEGQLSDPIETSSGVRQGCLLSPLLFMLFQDAVLRRLLNGKERGITWRLKESLADTEYMQMIYALYPIDTNICRGNWMISGRNLRN